MTKSRLQRVFNAIFFLLLLAVFFMADGNNVHVYLFVFLQNILAGFN